MPVCGQPGFKAGMAFCFPHTMQMCDLSMNPLPALCASAGWKSEPSGFARDMAMGRMCATSRSYFITWASVPAKCMKCFALESDVV